MKDFLELSGHRVIELATDWATSSTWLSVAVAVPDLIILDLQHPSMTGLAWLRQLRLSQWRHIPVVATSVSLSRHTQLLLKALGVHHYLVKPFCLDSLRQTIHEQLTRSTPNGQISRFWDSPTLNPMYQDVSACQD